MSPTATRVVGDFRDVGEIREIGVGGGELEGKRGKEGRTRGKEGADLE